MLRTDAFSQFFATSATPVYIPGVAPGQTAALVVRAWQGPSLAAAKLGGLQFMDETTDARVLLSLTGSAAVGFAIEAGSPLPHHSTIHLRVLRHIKAEAERGEKQGAQLSGDFGRCRVVDRERAGARMRTVAKPAC
jgi:hypothetical protein